MDFRQYDNALGRFLNPDRLSELAPGITPYRFAFNNPNYWSDPTGLFESWAAAISYALTNNISGDILFSGGENGFYYISTGSGLDAQNIAMFGGELSIVGTIIEEVSVIKGGGGGGSSGGSGTGGSGGGFSGGFGSSGFGFGGGGSGGFGGSGGGSSSSSGSGNKGYFANYFKDYFSYKRPAHANAYSPYIPDGTGFTISGTIGGFTVSISLVSGAAKTGVFLSTGGEFSLRESLFRGKVIGASATFDVYNNNGSSSLFEGIEGKNRTMSAGFILFGSYSYPIDNRIRDINGVTKTSFGLGTYSVGYGGGYTWWLF